MIFKTKIYKKTLHRQTQGKSKQCFFKALFEENKERFLARKCYYCEKFLTGSFDEQQHSFLKHYEKGGQIPLENRPFIIKTDNAIKKFAIEYDKNKDSYDSEDPVKLLKDFFGVVDVRFVIDRKKELFIKSTFTIQNYQPPPEGVNNAVGIYYKSVYSTPTYFGKIFNEFIKVSLINDIKKRIIVNAKTGSS